MMTQVKNTDKIVDDYLQKYPPYYSCESLGVNVAEILNYSKKVGKKVSELSKKD